MGRTRLSDRELGWAEAFGRVSSGSLTLKQACDLLDLSYRQGKRLWKRYGTGGAVGLQHGLCGRSSNRGYGAEFRAAVLKRVEERYGDFGPTLASEHLAADDGLPVARETLRRWLRAAGRPAVRKRRAYRKRREPEAHFGELVQMDGSFHLWLEERCEEGCLMHMVAMRHRRPCSSSRKRTRLGLRLTCCELGSSVTVFPRLSTRTGRTST